MCGIAGIAVSEPEPLAHAALAMATLLRHRGPDDEGYALFDASLAVRRHGGDDSVLPAADGDIRGADGPARVALAHRRLAIIDPSPAGHQPMPSARGDRWIAFNGEIYNYRELRDELRAAGHHFRSGSDTEVVLAAWDEWGPGCLTRMIGMWAFAIVDTTRRELVVARDPFGIKPLYTAVAGGRVAFASEHAALLSLPWVDRSEDPSAVYEYLVLGRTDAAEHTFHRGIRQLPAGSWARVDLDRIAPLEPVRYWRPRPGMVPGAESMSFAEAAAAVRERFMESVSLHLRSDVPVGACLSGGIDSSAIVCAMREIGGPQTEIHTFSYVPDDPRVSEERWIDLVARHVGAIRHTTRPDGASLTRQLDDLIAHQGEPFGSTSIYAQYEVFALAGAAGVKVLLDGQGADELLAGYVGYRITMIRDRWSNGQRLDALRRAAAMRHTSTTATSDLHFLRQTVGGRARRVTQRGRALAARVGVRPPVPTVRHLVDAAWTQAHVVPQPSAATDLHSQLVHSLENTSLRRCCATRTATRCGSRSRAGCPS